MPLNESQQAILHAGSDQPMAIDERNALFGAAMVANRIWYSSQTEEMAFYYQTTTCQDISFHRSLFFYS